MSFPSHCVIITAAGNSSRFNESNGNGQQKKEFLLLDNRTVLYHATLPFVGLPNLKAIIVTYGEGCKDETELALDNLIYTSTSPVILVQGGLTRQESVYLALQELEKKSIEAEYVLIHDGARPWIDEKTIIDTLATATVFGGAAPVLPIYEAVKKVDTDGRLKDHVDRSDLVTIQTPQAFHFKTILEAHHKAATTTKLYVDDTEIFTDFGGFVGTNIGNIKNRKITKFEDLMFGSEL